MTIRKARGMDHRLADGTLAVVTIHPSYLLRIEDKADKAREFRALVVDLRRAARMMARETL